MKLLQLAAADDLPRVLTMVEAFHTEMGFDTSPDNRSNAVLPLLQGSPHGAIWLIGPRKAPVGYIVVTFGWSIEFGGLDGIVDEIYIRPKVRSRGMGSEALNGLSRALSQNGVRALHLEVSRNDTATQKFYARAKFALREEYMFMSLKLI